MTEDEPHWRLLVRLYETDGKKGEAVLRFFCAPSRAWLTDLVENPRKDQGALRLSGETVRVDLEPHAVISVVVQFEGCR